MVTVDHLVKFLDDYLQPQNFTDYCPNGLQVQGKTEVARMVTGVTANRALIEKAIDAKADAILVHHGLFWKGQSLAITGLQYQKICALIKHDINLIAYHLPLDAHPSIGNNAQLGKMLSIKHIKWLDVDQNPGLMGLGQLAQPLAPKDFMAIMAVKLNREPMLLGSPPERIQTVAWCTGGAHQYLPLAIEKGVDAYITGEYSLPMAELAMEAGVALISAGHHATERGGVQALGQSLADQFNLNVDFIDIDVMA